MQYTIKVRSPYVDEIDGGIRTFEVIAEDDKDALYWAEQCVCAGREQILSIEKEEHHGN